MTSRDFCFWLQGKLEGREITDLTDSELNLIPSHLSLAFVHDIDPSMGNEEEQKKLNEIHNFLDSDQKININNSFSKPRFEGDGELMRC